MEEKFYWTLEEVHNYYNNLKSGKSLILPKDAYCTKNFTWNEVLRTNTRFFKTPPSEEILNNLKSMADTLQIYRDKFGKPIVITSSLRTKEEQVYLKANKMYPSDTSLHLEGLAMDFICSSLPLKDIHSYLDKVHVGEVEYGNNYTHISLPTFSKSYLKRHSGLDFEKLYGRVDLQGITIDDNIKNFILKRFYETNTKKLVPAHYSQEEHSKLYKGKQIHINTSLDKFSNYVHIN